MSTLTKVFVVLHVVFSIAFASMTVSMVARTANWRETAERYETHANVADTNLRHSQAANAATLAAARDEVRSKMERVRELESDLQEARNSAAQLTSELRTAASEKSSADAINRALLTQLQTVESARAEYQTQRDELEKQKDELQGRDTELTNRVDEQTWKIAALLAEKRQYEQQINTLKSENDKLSRRVGARAAGREMEDAAGAALSDVTALTAVAATSVRGKITDVEDDIVMLSVGSADGVTKGMVFVIHRDGQYVGDVKITLVNPDQSAGRLVRSTVSPAAGDHVTDVTSLGSSRG